MSDRTERWIKVLGLGFIVWVVPLLAENAFFYLQMYNAQIFNPVVLLIGVCVTLVALALYLPGIRSSLIAEGWILGCVWLLFCWAGDVLFFLITLHGHFSIAGYFLQEGWLHAYILICAVVCGYLAHAIDARSISVGQAPSVLPIR
jgi:hypothetical protein